MTSLSSPLKYFIEFLGTFFFLYIILSVVKKNSGMGAYSPIAIGLALIAAIEFGGTLSGGHFNPAVSLMFAIQNVLSWSDLFPYIFAQLLGGVAAKFFFDLMNN
jgi:aquaporin Z